MDELAFSVGKSHLDPFEPTGYAHTQLFTRPSTFGSFDSETADPSAPGQPQRSGWTETQVQHVHEYFDALFGRVRRSVTSPPKNNSNSQKT